MISITDHLFVLKNRIIYDEQINVQLTVIQLYNVQIVQIEIWSEERKGIWV
jgi:hypothetical protein